MFPLFSLASLVQSLCSGRSKLLAGGGRSGEGVVPLLSLIHNSSYEILCPEKYFSENIFRKKFEKMFAFIFQSNITFSDLHEFLIGQNICKAANLLFRLSTTFMGLAASLLTPSPKTWVGEDPVELTRGC